METESVPVYSLYEAEKLGHAKFLWAIGDGSTVRLRVTIRNLRNYAIRVRIDPGTTMTPHEIHRHQYQQMTVIRPTEIGLGPLETRSFWVNTACLQANLPAPHGQNAEQVRQRQQNLRKKLGDYLRSQGLNTKNIDDLVEEYDDGLRTRIQDLQRVAESMGYSTERIQEIQAEMEDLCQREPPVIHLGYSLTYLSSEQSAWINSIVHAIEELDDEIHQLAERSKRTIGISATEKEIVQLFGSELGKRKELEQFLYLAHLDPGLRDNVFNNSGFPFKVGEAVHLIEVDPNYPNDQEPQARLNSIVAQYAIWSMSDNLGLEECCSRIKREGREASLMGAGVRTVLHRASTAPGVDRTLSSRLRKIPPLFAHSSLGRTVGRIRKFLGV
jgi:hypothetical protein